MVKKHSNLVGKTVVEEQDASDVEMDMRFWRDVFDLDVTFICGRAGVYALGAVAAKHGGDGDSMRYCLSQFEKDDGRLDRVR
ncbi:unnamed protein product [Lupinus luteus]|uniref:Uncharacterized protein n=1 Tax=Lupinus luteus TaxID=3873 RepID=A0AAV1W6N9_LUPLU